MAFAIQDVYFSCSRSCQQWLCATASENAHSEFLTLSLDYD